MHQIKISPPKVHQTKFGAFPHSEFIGRKFGTKVRDIFQFLAKLGNAANMFLCKPVTSKLCSLEFQIIILLSLRYRKVTTL